MSIKPILSTGLNSSPIQEHNLNEKQLRVAVLTSKCGGLEIIASAIKEALQNRFPLAHILTGGKHDELVDSLLPTGSWGLAIHRKAAEKQEFRYMAVALKLGRQFASWKEADMQGKLDAYIREFNPHLIVSAAPLINSALLRAAASYNIPVLTVTADMDNSLYSHHWPTTPLAPHRYIIPYFCQEIVNTIHPGVDKTKVLALGYPIRPEFSRDVAIEERQQLRQELFVPEGKKLILLMVGGSLGSQGNYAYVKEIIALDRPAHYVVLCGRQEAMKQALEKLLQDMGFTEEVDGHKKRFIKGALSFDIQGFRKDVHKFYSIARCIITKPGPGTFNEALVQKVPLLLDDTAGHIPWEGMNIGFAEQYGLGKGIFNLREIGSALDEMLTDATHEKYLQALTTFREERPGQFHFRDNLQNAAVEILEEARAIVLSPPVEKTKESCCITAKKVAIFILKVLCFPFIQLHHFFTEWLPKKIIQFAFFSAFILAKDSVLSN